MKKLLLLAAAMVAAITINAQKIVFVASEVANYIDFEAIRVSDPQITQATINSENPYTLDNGSVLKNSNNASCYWYIRNGYIEDHPTPYWNGVDSLKVGSVLRAGTGVTIELGAFSTTADGNLTVFYQPNGDLERGVKITVKGEEISGTGLTCSGMKIDGVRPANAGYITLPAGEYAAGDVVIEMIVNTSSLIGVGIENLVTAGINNIQADKKRYTKIFSDGQLLLQSEGKTFNVLGIEVK